MVVSRASGTLRASRLKRNKFSEPASALVRGSGARSLVRQTGARSGARKANIAIQHRNSSDGKEGYLEKVGIGLRECDIRNLDGQGQHAYRTVPSG